MCFVKTGEVLRSTFANPGTQIKCRNTAIEMPRELLEEMSIELAARTQTEYKSHGRRNAVVSEDSNANDRYER